MKAIKLAAATSVLLLTSACGRGEPNEGGISAKERADLDNAAMMVEGNQMFDTSADSLVIDESPANANAPSGNAAGPIPVGNSTNSVAPLN